MKTKKKSSNVQILLAEYSECGETIRQFTNFFIIAFIFIAGNIALWQTVNYPLYIFAIVSIVVVYLIPYLGFNIVKAQDRAVAIEKKLRHRGYYTLTREQFLPFLGRVVTFYMTSYYVLILSLYFFLFIWFRILSVELTLLITVGAVAIPTVVWVKVRYKTHSSKRKK